MPTATTENKKITQQLPEDVIARANQSIAQSTAIAIQDAVDNLRNISTITTTVLGVAVAQVLANTSNNGSINDAIRLAQSISDQALANYKNVISQTALLKDFPKTETLKTMTENKTQTSDTTDDAGNPADNNLPEDNDNSIDPSEDMLDLVLAQSLGMAMHNAVAAQQNAHVLNTAIVSAICRRILSSDGNLDQILEEEGILQKLQQPTIAKEQIKATPKKAAAKKKPTSKSTSDK